jgi:DegV family protein with EDD domain
MRVLVSTDTSCLVRQGQLKDTEISVFPLNVIIDGEEFLDGVTINQDQLRDAMRSGKNIKTSTPPLGTIIEYFEGLFEKGYDHVIHFTISSKLSSMYDLFCNVAEQNFKGKVTVIDGYGVSTIQLWKVLYAYEQTKKGTPVEEIVSFIEEKKTDNYVVFVPENLQALKNGGRISPAVALIGNTIGIKPVIKLEDGALEKDSMTRRTRKTFIEQIDLLKGKYTTDLYDYTLLSFDAKEEEVQYILAHAEEALGKEAVARGIIPINVCAHCGPGTIGLAVSPKHCEKSIREF